MDLAHDQGSSAPDDAPRLRGPSAAEIAGFANVPTGHAVDAMGGRGALDHRIKPLARMTSVMIGVAITCHCGPADNLALFAALAAAKSGDVLVAATDGFTATSITGDLLMGMARNRGVTGLVTDGLARDVVGILGVGLPVYCVGLRRHPRILDRNMAAGVDGVVPVAVKRGEIMLPWYGSVGRK